jgi:crotonobetaine/carnitine-CoA ligase
MAGLPDISHRTLLAAYERALQARPDEVAQVGRDGSWTFAASFDRSLRLAAGLRAQGGERAASPASRSSA